MIRSVERFFEIYEKRKVTDQTLKPYSLTRDFAIRIIFYTPQNITKTRLFKYIDKFTTKNKNFQMKHSGSCHTSAQSIDCGYLLEPPRWVTVYPRLVNPTFTVQKWGLKGSKLYRRVYVMNRESQAKALFFVRTVGRVFAGAVWWYIMGFQTKINLQ